VNAPNFYSLSFAEQMVVWATRKQLRSVLAADGLPDDVLSVFHLADWGAIYDSLLAVVEVLASSRDLDQLVAHAVSCPRLAPHEVSILNALAHLQRQHPVDAALDLCDALRPSSARAVLRHLQKLSDGLSAQGLVTHFVAKPPPDRLASAHMAQGAMH
jgi:hypothetical protein